MIKKLTKILLIILTVFTVYFIKMESVRALGIKGIDGEPYIILDPKESQFVSPINPFDADGKPLSRYESCNIYE